MTSTSSFTFKISLKTESLSKSLREVPSTNLIITKLRVTLRVPKAAAAKEAVRGLAKVLIIAISVMALNAKKEDNLGTVNETRKSSEAGEPELTITQNNTTAYNSTGDNKDSRSSSFQHECKRKSSKDRINRKRKWIRNKKSNEKFDEDKDRIKREGEESEEVDDDEEDDDDSEDEKRGKNKNDEEDDTYDNEYKADELIQSKHNKCVDVCPSLIIDNKKQCASQPVKSLETKEADCKDEALGNHNQFAEFNKITSPVHTYVAPEQALVTRVELVVPAPMSAPSAASAASAAAAVAAVFESVSHNSSSKLQYDSDVLFDDASSATLSKNNEAIKNNGCATDSSKLNVRIPTNITSATGDILSTTERRATIWAPHDEYKGTHNQTQIHEDTPGSGSLNHMEQSRGHLHHGSETDHLPIEAVPNTYQQSDIYQHRHQQQQQHEQQLQQHHHQDQQQQRLSLVPPSELLLQIEKEAGVVGFGQMHQLHHHHALAHQQLSHQESPFQNNMYAQMMQHQHQQQHHLHHSLHQQSIHNEQQQHQLQQHQQQHQQQSIHFPNYEHQHYSQEQLFNMHHPLADQCQTQSQQQSHHIECHDHLQQQQQRANHPQQQMQDAYHDLMMDEYHEDPATAYKL